MLTVSDVCERLQLSRPIVYRLISSGQLRSLKLGRSRRITVEALHEFVATASQIGA